VDLDQKAKQYGLRQDELEEKLALARQKLFEVREKRVHPHKDDKILTAWNGLMIAALSKAAAALNQPHYLHMAKRAVQMIETRLKDEAGRLLARLRDEDARYLAYLDDYAFYIWGLDELYFASGEARYLELAQHYLDETLQRFWDQDQGAFFFTAHDAEALVARTKEIYDGALPSGNGVMAFNLTRHWLISSEDAYRKKAEEILQTFGESISDFPSVYPFSLLALQLLNGQGTQVVITEGDDPAEFIHLMQTVQKAYLPLAVLVYRKKNQLALIDSLAKIHQDKPALYGRATLYLCQNFTCQSPLTDLNEIKNQLSRHN
jgi:hypothetical protein